ncbi:hypothetical protein [Geomonas anaerohicana]|uniref:Uncharacterized protein n=1 Tax=Geomonas anaerohicana TaxID=2798583 RepID=A0ABS0YC72_9BACT|nr:hypothetical protein [Geomonas anaerohicana]MBJ6749880.1 hypothetical protein [Geomonas anaerohicana]
MSDLTTHGGGKARRFSWACHGDLIAIVNEKGRTHTYHLDEVFRIYSWLFQKFDNGWFPLANNVKKLGGNEEIAGLGVAILSQRPGDIAHAQGASYLGVLLEDIGVLEWNLAKKGIQWRIIKRVQSLDALRAKLHSSRRGI